MPLSSKRLARHSMAWHYNGPARHESHCHSTLYGKNMGTSHSRKQLQLSGSLARTRTRQQVRMSDVTFAFNHNTIKTMWWCPAEATGP